jgi:hypothetical protein
MISVFRCYVEKGVLEKLTAVTHGEVELCTLQPWSKHSVNNPVELTIYYTLPAKTALPVRLRIAYDKIKTALVELLRG